MSREMGALVRNNFAYFSSWDRIIIYYDNGQKELTNVVNSTFNAHLGNVEVRKIATTGLSASERDFFATEKRSAEQALKRLYFKTLDRRRFGS